MDDVIGFVWYINEEGIREYACRGIGLRYSKFYDEWVPKSSYRFIRMDWPWDMFVFDNPEDHTRLVNDFLASCDSGMISNIDQQGRNT